MSPLSLSLLPLALPVLGLGPGGGARQLRNRLTLDMLSPLPPSSPQSLPQTGFCPICSPFHLQKKAFWFYFILILEMEKHSLLLVSNQKGCKSLNQLKPTSHLAPPQGPALPRPGR